jgi:hypothetical protein
MKIGNIGTQASKLAATTVNRESAKPTASSVASPVAATRAPARDAVTLSAEGLAMSKSDAASAARLAEIRQRVHQKAYDSSAILESVARAILKSGDL